VRCAGLPVVSMLTVFRLGRQQLPLGGRVEKHHAEIVAGWTQASVTPKYVLKRVGGTLLGPKFPFIHS